MTQNLAPVGLGLPAEHERDAARQLRGILLSLVEGGHDLELRDASGETATVALGPAMTELILGVLRPFSEGEPVTHVPVFQEMTTQEAADILNVSRPSLIKLLEDGAIPFHKVGTHRRVRLVDLLVYRSERDSARHDALSEMAEADGDLI